MKLYIGLCFSGQKFLLNANTTSIRRFKLIMRVMVGIVNAKRKNPPNIWYTYTYTFAHIFGKSKFAKPFPFYTTNCLRLLSTLMVVVVNGDGRCRLLQLLFCLFVCISFVRTARKFIDGKLYISFQHGFRFRFNRKMIKIFQAKITSLSSLFIIHCGKEQF